MRARILVVDDEAEIRQSVRMILEYEGYDIQEASSGPEGSRSSRRNRPTSCSSTSRCRASTGSRSCRRSRRRTESLPVVIISGTAP